MKALGVLGGGDGRGGGERHYKERPFEKMSSLLHRYAIFRYRTVSAKFTTGADRGQPVYVVLSADLPSPAAEILSQASRKSNLCPFTKCLLETHFIPW